MKKQISAALIAVFITFGAAASLQAEQNKPVELAAQTIEYNSATGLMTAQGGVRMIQDDAVLTGTSAEYNTKTREAYVAGGVKVVKGDATLTSAEVRSYDNNHLIATGGAVLVKGDNTLTGPKIDYYSDRQYAVVPGGARLTMPDGFMTANQIEAFIDQDKAVGTGNVHIVSDVRKLDAVADNATYYGTKEGGQGKAILTGNARAVQDGNILTGETLTIRMDDKAMDATGRTKLVVQPQ
ncbi:LPS-assembly protein LptD [bioreactor metagenome]|uniref:LPS-assembly protein LptD n=1 Tax=bioreactor metagenome TaxID=1076179 RepID=A0A644TQM1_9ZZZZ